MKGQPTPGPWRAVIWRHSGQPDTVCVKDAQGREIIGWPGFDGVPCTKAEIRANAKLAAAAPDLLAALKGLIPRDFDQHPGDFAEDWHRARAAVARAEGRP